MRFQGGQRNLSYLVVDPDPPPLNVVQQPYVSYTWKTFFDVGEVKIKLCQ